MKDGYIHTQPNGSCGICAMHGGAHVKGCPNDTRVIISSDFPLNIGTAEESGPKSVPEMLRSAAEVFEQRNSAYSDNYKHAGEALMGLFPRGVVVQNAEEFNRLHLILHMYSKLSRYCMNLKNGGHEDSLVDIAVYATMAREVDAEDAKRMETGK